MSFDEDIQTIASTGSDDMSVMSLTHPQTQFKLELDTQGFVYSAFFKCHSLKVINLTLSSVFMNYFFLRELWSQSSLNQYNKVSFFTQDHLPLGPN